MISRNLRLLIVIILFYLLTSITILNFLDPFSPVPSEKLGNSENGRNEAPIRLSDATLNVSERAASTHCKNLIGRIGISEILRNNFTVNNKCPHRTNLIPSDRFLGCFNVTTSRLTSILNQHLYDWTGCVNFCFLAGVRFALITSDNTCVCDNTVPTDLAAVNLSTCQTACSPFTRSGLNASSCGSTVAVRIFDTAAIQPFHISPPPLRPLTQIPDRDPVRILYLLVWHGRGWAQARRIFRSIYHPRHYYFIHVDSRANYLHSRAKVLAQQYPANVHVTDDRYAANWGSPNLLRMMLSVMRDLIVRLTWWHWDYLINMSGSDLPVRSRELLVSYLSEHRGKIFFSVNVDIPSFVHSQGLNHLFFDCDNYIWNLGQRGYPSGIVLDGGSDWMILPRDFVEYVVLTTDAIHTQLVQFFLYSLLPAEMFFHVVAQNTHFCSSVVSYGLRYAHWDRPRGCSCKHNVSVAWCGCSPVAFRGQYSMRQLCNQAGHCPDGAPKQTPVFFARKFDSTIDLNALNFVTSTLLGEEPDSTTWGIYLENIYSASEDKLEVSPMLSDGLQAVAQHIFSHLINQDELIVKLSFPDPDLEVYALFDAKEQREWHYQTVTSGRFTLPHIPKLVFHKSARTDSLTPVWIETVVQPRALYYLSPVPLSTLSDGQIVYGEVATVFDTKEQFTRDYPRLLFPTDKLQLILYWKAPRSVIKKPFRLNVTLADSTCLPSSLTLRRTPGTAVAFGCNDCALFITYLHLLFPGCSFSSGYLQLIISSPGEHFVRVPFYLYQHPLTPATLSRSPWASVPSLHACWSSVLATNHSTLPRCSDQFWSTFARDAKSELPT